MHNERIVDMGFNAYIDGRTVNPFTKGSRLAEAWDYGFTLACCIQG